MFWCCCTQSERETEVKPMGSMDEYSTDSMGEEAVLPGDPVAVSSKAVSAEPSLGRIDEEGDGTAARGATVLEGDETKGDTYLVTLQRTPQDDSKVVDSLFGITLFYSDATTCLEIIDVDETHESVKAYNAAAEAGRKLVPGHLILAVNGASDSVAVMLASWKESTEVNCVVCRPVEFTINVIKVEGGMGIDVTHSTKGTSLLVEGIQAGPVLKWNKSNPEKKVQVADRIVAINGVRGSPTELKGALKGASGKIELVIARRP